MCFPPYKILNSKILIRIMMLTTKIGLLVPLEIMKIRFKAVFRNGFFFYFD